MVSFTAGGTVMGKYLLNTATLLYINYVNFLSKTMQVKTNP
jgi:hypothetical protein